MQKGDRRIARLRDKQSGVGEQSLHRFYCILMQGKIRKERSDFAAVEFWRRGWRPRQPVSGSCEDWIFTKLSGGTKRANDVRPYRFVAVGSCFSRFFIQFSSYVRGATLGIMPLVAYTQNITMHTHALTQVLYSLFQKRTSVSLSRRACTCPQVSKRFLLIHENHHFCCIKNATIAEMLPN